MTGTVLGVDPGTKTTGFGLVEATPGRPGTLIECGVIRTDPKQHMWYRLDTLFEGLMEVIERHGPSVMAVETVFYGKNARSAASLSQARGVILLAAARSGLEVREFTPASIKKAITGSGRAGKEQVAYMVQKLLRLESPPLPDDAADGVAIALTSLMARNHGS